MVGSNNTSKGKSKNDVTAEEIVVTAQQSRFHIDASDVPNSREIDIKDIAVGINGRELLNGAHLRLKHGVHYVLVGRNGTEKSTLLKALAEERVPGVPMNLQCVLLGQTLLESSKQDETIQHPKHMTTLEHGIARGACIIENADPRSYQK